RTIMPLDRVLQQSGYDGSGVLVHGGDEPQSETQLICGHFSFEPNARHILMERLPPFIHLKNYGETAGRWMEATLRVIGDEAGGQRMGGDLIALKMSETIFAQAIRSFIESGDAPEWGLGAFSDAHLRRALDAFHKAPSRNWTVEALARDAGMSRTSFAVLFQKKMAMTPMEYVTGWRMEIAKKLLAKPGIALTDAAQGAGYASDSAFARVFKKETGFTPESCHEALYMPPVSKRIVLRSAAAFESMGPALRSAFAGVHIVEAKKEMLQPVTVKKTSRIAIQMRPSLAPASANSVLPAEHKHRL
ncbi:MAG: AraC family transcriptional regulator, partial [Hyphomicrobiales bacterium]|nr:AraC family transcriptional regulator [Hyphomicrobiales bacterium]